jgi:hypothetical protein
LAGCQLSKAVESQTNQPADGFCFQAGEAVYNGCMQRATIRRLIGIVLLFLSAVLLVWSLWPPRLADQELTLQIVRPANLDEHALKEPAALGVHVTIPERVRTDQIQEVRLSLAGPETAPDPAILISSRLDLPGMDVGPAGEFNQALTPGQPVQFNWSIRARQPGSYTGTLWLYSAGTSAHQASASERQLLLAQPVAITAASLFGLGGPAAQVIGMVGIVIGAALAADLLLAGTLRRLERSQSGSGSSEGTRSPG